LELSLSGFLFERQYSTCDLTIEEFARVAVEAGYNAVELRKTQVNPDTSADEVERIRSTIRDAGLYVSCITTRGMPGEGAERNEFLLRYLDLATRLGCRLIKTGGDPDWCRWAAEKASEVGVALASNNHVGGVLETVSGTLEHLGNINHPNFGLLYDPLHLYVGAEDYLGCIAEFVGITRNILVQSVRPGKPGEQSTWQRGGRAWVSALPDEPGVQDWSAILNTFKRLHYGGLITVIENGWPSQRRRFVAQHCAEVIRSLWNRCTWTNQ